jgi:hypothetical protein
MSVGAGIPTSLEWWPISLSERAAEALAAFTEELADGLRMLEQDTLARAETLLTQAMHVRVHDIIDGAAVSHYCHLINGWGDATINGGRLLDGLAFFLLPGPGGPRLLQFHRDGDFHPWQSLAYALMAGADIDRRLPDAGVSLREIYAQSREFPTRDGEELGHLLFALAHIDPPEDLSFRVCGEAVGLPELMQRAIAGHQHGHFKVCSKIHLTEGICAAAARIPSLAGYREQAQAFLDGQLDMMLLLAMSTRERLAAQLEGRVLEPDSLSNDVLGALARTTNFEDHLFLAGHQVELACFAAAFGYEVPAVHRRAMVELIDATNRALPLYLPRSDFAEHFLFYGHYRRAITMLAAMQEAELQGRAWTADAETLAGFCVDFERPCVAPELPETRGPDVWTFAPHKLARPEFLRLAEVVRAQLPEHFELRGYRSHYRTVRPQHWPRSLHYELLDHTAEGPWYSIELHVEARVLAPLNPVIEGLREVFVERVGEQLVGWQTDWFDGGCRLRAFIAEDMPASEIAELCVDLISRTFATVDAAHQSLCEGTSSLGLVQPRVFAERLAEREAERVRSPAA